jgi:hypothetical protein
MHGSGTGISNCGSSVGHFRVNFAPARVQAATIDESVCVGRLLDPAFAVVFGFLEYDVGAGLEGGAYA